MKVFISADIEGVAWTCCRDEVNPGGSGFARACRQMTAEVAAACRGALEAGATEILVKDGHAQGLNIIPDELPKQAKLFRGWSGHPYSMMSGLDDTFDAAMLIGYHAGGGRGGNPLAHTISNSAVEHIQINDQMVSEFLINAFTAGLVSVPLVLVSGDQRLCDHVKSVNSHIGTVAVKEGIGGGVVAIQPQLATEKIQAKATEALNGDLSCCQIDLPDYFEVSVRYHDHAKAMRSSFYPGAKLETPHTLVYETEDYYEVLRLLMFVL